MPESNILRSTYSRSRRSENQERSRYRDLQEDEDTLSDGSSIRSTSSTFSQRPPPSHSSQRRPSSSGSQRPRPLSFSSQRPRPLSFPSQRRHSSSTSQHRPSSSSSRGRPSTHSSQLQPTFPSFRGQPSSPLSDSPFLPSTPDSDRHDQPYNDPAHYEVRAERPNVSPLGSPRAYVVYISEETAQDDPPLAWTDISSNESSPFRQHPILPPQTEDSTILKIVEAMAMSQDWAGWLSPEDQNQDSQESLVPYSPSPSAPPGANRRLSSLHATDVESLPSAVVPMIHTEAFDKQSTRCLNGCITRQSRHAVAFGGFADIWDGFLGAQRVAIKTIRPFSSAGNQIEESKLLRRLQREYSTWSSISHPNVLECLGFSYDFSREPHILPALISPWMCNGTVFPYFEKFPDADRLKLLLGIARGLSHLHDRQIIHGDLRAGNILISDSGVPCLSDFGLSRTLQAEEMSTTSELAGSLRWMSPELLSGQIIVTPSSDVWAFGMTVLEITSGRHPYYELKADVLVLGQLKDGGLPARPRNAPTLTDSVWAICQQCWIIEPQCRDSMHAVLDNLCPFAD